MNTAIDPSEASQDRLENLQTEPRRQLLERIVSSAPFQKATRLQSFLRYIVEHSLQGRADELSEYHIGREVFEKGPDYSPLEDSSVRVQARQLRLKLHEYFDGPGREESLILEIPKGSYAPTFRAGALPSPETPPAPLPIQEQAVEQKNEKRFSWLPWGLVFLLGCISVVLAWQLRLRSSSASEMPWPLNSIFDGHTTPRIIVADSAYQIALTADGQPASLDAYLQARHGSFDPNGPPDTLQARKVRALGQGTYTSFADAAVVSAIARVAGQYQVDLNLESAKDIEPRDLEQGNFILIGSPSSNPWVLLYENRLNFKEVVGPDDLCTRCFLNLHPLANEARTYSGNAAPDAVREEFADLAVVPGLGRHGNVMLIQGLRHEGTEAIGRMLVTPESIALFRRYFAGKGLQKPPQFFEALLSIRAVAGIPHVAEVVAFRTIQP